MKRILILAIAMLLIAGVAYAGIVGSKHDMTNDARLTGETLGYAEGCGYCHTPHGAATSGMNTIPLRDRSSRSGPSHTVYTSSTFNNTMPATLNAGSGACMTCHDGTMAISALYNTPNNGGLEGTGTGNLSAGRMLTAGRAAFGTDLSDDHPVSISITTSYNDEGGASSQLYPAATIVSNGVVRLFGAGPAFVECASCHNVHNFAYTPFLRTSNAGSALCLACHNK